MRKVFSVDTKSSTRVIIYILGIRIRFLKSEYKHSKNIYTSMYKNSSEIPAATGVLRKIQLANLKLLQILDRICAENKFEYWLDFGNLLGAIRHGGFIPWDDDVDISMTRVHYESFIKLLDNHPEKYPDVYYEYDNNGKNRCFVKFRHKDLKNIAIDIFPYDFYYKKTNELEKQELTTKIKSVTKSKINKYLFPFYIFSPQKMRKRFLKDTNKYILDNFKVDIETKPSLFAAVDYNHMHRNLVFDYEDIFPLQLYKYEGLDFYIPNNYKQVLSQYFGNYMEIPEDCYPHHAKLNDKEFESNLDTFLGN